MITSTNFTGHYPRKLNYCGMTLKKKGSEEGFNYNQLEQWQEDFRPHGVTFEFSLDAMPYNITFKK